MARIDVREDPFARLDRDVAQLEAQDSEVELLGCFDVLGRHDEMADAEIAGGLGARNECGTCRRDELLFGDTRAAEELELVAARVEASHQASDIALVREVRPLLHLDAFK